MRPLRLARQALPRLALPRLALAGLALASALALGPACSGKDPYNPGQTLGIFHVTGKLTSNACAGPGGAPDPWEFEVKLSRDGTTLYWIQGGLPVQGHLDAKNHALLQSSGTTELRAGNTQAKVSGCSLTRTDSLDATLGKDSPVTTFTGSLSYAYTPTAESDCSDQLAVAGGGWASLPCDIAYTITATKTDKTKLTY